MLRKALEKMSTPDSTTEADMTSSGRDVTLMMTSDAKEWGTYILDKLKAFPKVTCASLTLDELDYENSPEISRACRESAVTLLLASPCLLTFLRDKAAWFAPTLQREVPTSSAVFVVLLLRQSLVDDVTKDAAYVTAGWRYADAGTSVQEVQEMLARVLDVVESCRPAAAPEASSPRDQSQSQSRTPGDEDGGEQGGAGAEGGSPEPAARGKNVPGTQSSRPSLPAASPGKAGVQLFPSVVYECGTRVAAVFDHEVAEDLSIVLKQGDVRLSVTRENSRVVSFTVPQLAPGRYSLTVVEDGHRLTNCRPRLDVRGLDTAVLVNSACFLAQALGADDRQDLDVRLKDAFLSSLPSGDGLRVLLQHLPPHVPSEQDKCSESCYPTLLHYAAAFGLSEFCAALLDCPASSRAFRIRNCRGQNPAELAAAGGFDELEDYILDFIEIQTADEESTLYIDMDQTSPQEAEDSEAEDYEDMAGLTLAPKPRVRLLSEPHCFSPTTGPLRPFPRSDGAPPPLAATLEDEEGGGGEDPRLSFSGRPERPPLPPPRTMASQRHRSQPDLKLGIKASTLPVGSNLDPASFMGMTGSTQEPHGNALNSRSQEELVDIHDMVKSGEISINQARQLFKTWQHRYSQHLPLSFKQRQSELEEMKKLYADRRELQRKEERAQQAGKGFFSGFRRQNKQTIKLDITHPVLYRGQKKATKAYTKSASSGQLTVSAAGGQRGSNTSSNCSSRDSGMSRGSRDSNMSGSYDTDVKREHRQSLGCAFLQQAERERTEGGTNAPPPLPPRLPPR